MFSDAFCAVDFQRNRLLVTFCLTPVLLLWVGYALAETRTGDSTGFDSSAGYRWIKAQPKSNFTIQVFAFNQEHHALSYVKSNDLNGEVIVFETEQDGAQLYRGLYGSYASIIESEKARDELAARIPAQGFWLRRFADIVRDIESDRKGIPVVAKNSGIAGHAVGKDNSTALGSFRAGQWAFNRQNYLAAYEIWAPLADQGVAEAQYGLGFMFESGWGVSKDYGKAAKWYRLAAEQGHAKSQYNLGILYLYGRGVAQDEMEGRRWIEASARGNDDRALSYIRDNDPE